VVNRLLMLRAAGDLSHAHVEQAAAGVGVTARTIYRWLSQGWQPAATRGRGYQLSETDRMAYENFRGNVAVVHRARTAALAREATAAGVPIADHLLAGWAGAEPVALRTLQLDSAVRPAEPSAPTGNTAKKPAATIGPMASGPSHTATRFGRSTTPCSTLWCCLREENRCGPG
jgi:putative transposase